MTSFLPIPKLRIVTALATRMDAFFYVSSFFCLPPIVNESFACGKFGSLNLPTPESFPLRLKRVSLDALWSEL